MKLEIFGAVETKKEEPTRLKLTPSLDGGIKVIAVDERGMQVTQGNILTFTKDGKITLHRDVSRHLGFDLDLSGRARIHGAF